MGKFKNQNRYTLKNQVVAEIQKAIIDGRLKPGERLNEAQISQEMGLSKAPVREAIKELTAGGILFAEPFKGTYVKGLSRKEAHELFSMRNVLESYAIELILPEICQKDLDLLGSTIDKMKIAAENCDQKRLSDLDLNFHRQIIKISGHDLLSEIWDKIVGRARIYLYQKSQVIGDLNEIYSIHKNLFEILCTKDAKIAKSCLEDHFNHSLNKALAILNGKSN